MSYSNSYSHSRALAIAVAAALFIPLLITLLYPELNQQTFLSINQAGGLLPDAIWANITFFGDGLWAIGFISVCVFIAYHKDPLGSRSLAIAAVYGGIILGIVTQVLKRYFAADRPSRFFTDVDFNVIGEPLSFNSFPSGHSATIFYMAAIIIAYFGIRSIPQLLLASALTADAALIALSRVTTGVHFPADILAGSLLGWVFGWLTISFIRTRLENRGARKPGAIPTAIALLLIGLCSAMLIFHDPHLPQTELLRIASGIIFVGFSTINILQLRKSIYATIPNNI